MIRSHSGMVGRRVGVGITRAALRIEKRLALQTDDERLVRTLGWLGLAAVVGSAMTLPFVASSVNLLVCLPVLVAVTVLSLAALRLRNLATPSALATGVAVGAQTVFTAATGDADSPYLAGFILIVLAVAAVSSVGRTAAASLQGGGGLLVTALIDRRLEAAELLAVINQVFVMLLAAMLVSGLAWRRRLQIKRVSRHLIRAQSAATLHERESRTDALTGCGNRRAFEDDLAALESRASLGAVAIVVIDADNLKVVNDSLGHDAGDRMLRAIATKLAESLRTNEVVYRIGGDEFALILAATDLEGLSARLRDRVSAMCEGVGMVTASVGTVQGCADDTAATLVGRADRAMYNAKGRGPQESDSQEKVASAHSP